jgi:hypothetical protein
VNRERISHLEHQLPQSGLFRDKTWVLSPQAFPLSETTVSLIQALGPALLAFQSACNELYFRSLEQPALHWLHLLLDAGKPAEILALSRHPQWRHELPRVLRPDLILSADGSVSITELDSVPGGIGLLGWLNQTYHGFGENIIGGPEGMLRGFSTAYPGADILISAESGDYEPEMHWLIAQLNQLEASNGPRRLFKAENLTASDLQSRRSWYRFFELFDLPNLGLANDLLHRASRGEASLSAPPKAFLEEKLWLALFWLPSLESYWREALSPPHWTLLRRCIPPSWVLDPTPLPAWAVHPGLNLHSWQELHHLGRSERELVLKASGFSELAWGSRSVSIGHDLSVSEWQQAVSAALRSFPQQPYILQRFHNAGLYPHPAWQPDRQQITPRVNKVRLCPYYFTPADRPDRAQLSGILATLCPADKKILHGMKDAMLLPCTAATE